MPNTSARPSTDATVAVTARLGLLASSQKIFAAASGPALRRMRARSAAESLIGADSVPGSSEGARSEGIGGSRRTGEGTPAPLVLPRGSVRAPGELLRGELTA